MLAAQKSTADTQAGFPQSGRAKYGEDLEAQLASYKGRYRILVADLDGSDYRSFKGGPPSMCVFSNEAHGPSEGIRAMADGIATIPGHGGAESLSAMGSASPGVGLHLTANSSSRAWLTR